MAKKRISAGELSWKVTERIRQSPQFPKGVAVAVVHEPDGSWRIVVESRSRSYMNAGSIRQLAAIQNELQGNYSLRHD